MSVAVFPIPPVVKTVTVRAPPARAFEMFARDIARWWPLASHHVAPDPVECCIEPHVGGRILERAANGHETPWGVVPAYDPPHRLAFSWFVGIAPEQAQLIEIRFAAAEGGTRVELTHTGWEKLGEAAGRTRDAYDRGWATVFEYSFADYANAAT
jgi:uncharacterized protein YndB with AHSA1/START domain